MTSILKFLVAVAVVSVIQWYVEVYICCTAIDKVFFD